MTNDRIDFDAEATRLGQLLSTVSAYIVAARVHQSEYDLNFREALETAISVRANAEMILRYADPREFHNIERFREMFNKSTKLTREFWKLFQLESVATESGKTVTLVGKQIEKADNLQESKPRKLAATNGSHVKRGTRRPTVSDDQFDEIETYILKNYDGKLSMKDREVVAKKFNVSVSTVERAYYGRR